MTERLRTGMLRPTTVPEIEAPKSSDIWLDDNGLVSDETSEIVAVESIYKRAIREFPTDMSEGNTTRKLQLGKIPNAYHTTDVAQAIRASGIILSVFYPDSNFEGGYEPSQNWHLDPSYSIHFPAEKSAKSIRNGGLPIPLLDVDGKPRFRMFMTIPRSVEDMALARVKNKQNEYVATRKLTKTTDELRESGFSFLSQNVEVTGVPGQEFLADIPITEELQQASVRFALKTVFDVAEPILAQDIYDFLKYHDKKHKVQFYNGHGDCDGLRTLSVLWAHTTMRSYWERYGSGVVSMIMDTEHDEWLSESLGVDETSLFEVKSIIWNKFIQQFRDPSLELHWHQQQAFLCDQGFVADNNHVDLDIVDKWFSKTENVDRLLRTLSAVNPENGLRYLRSRGDSGYSPYIPPGMLAGIVDCYGLAVDESTRLIDWTSISKNMPVKEQLVVYADSFDWDSKAEKAMGRFQPIRSTHYQWYRDNWVDHFDDV